jgi:hypothetical protein
MAAPNNSQGQTKNALHLSRHQWISSLPADPVLLFIAAAWLAGCSQQKTPPGRSCDWLEIGQWCQWGARPPGLAHQPLLDWSIT